MKLLTISIFLLGLLGLHQCKDAKNDTHLEDLEKALKNLMKIIEEHQMNITIITAEISHWANGDVKEVKESAVHLPTNNLQLTESNITEKEVQEWLASTENLQSKISGQSRTAHIKDGETEKIDKKSTTKGLFETRLYKTVVSVKNDERCFTVENPSYENYYNAHILGEDGKNETIEVITAHLEVKVLEKSEAITKEEVSELERKMRQIYFKYEDVVMGKVLRDHMNSRFNNSDWQVIMSPGDEFYVPAKKYACIKAANTEALVYSMK